MGPVPLGPLRANSWVSCETFGSSASRRDMWLATHSPPQECFFLACNINPICAHEIKKNEADGILVPEKLKTPGLIVPDYSLLYTGYFSSPR
ncbi:hypothetical protein XENTR_v10015180 [Xenopus tropicalis]|nr:hypothetical protein XENTR_v10015180 [Xenopus tropicalis]